MLWERVPFWEYSADAFGGEAAALGFRWTSEQKDSARSVGPGLTLGGLPVVEAIARFKQDKITGLTLQIYTRGDKGPLSKAEYEELIKRCTDSVNNLSQVKPQPRGQDYASSVRAEGIVWQTNRTNWLLEYSAAREMTPMGLKLVPEFVRLEMTPRTAKAASSKTAVEPMKGNPKDRVKKLANGDVQIEGIPMVDQGEKGYCFPATAERVLRSYGMRVDQNELAQLAGNKGGGTSLRAGVEGLKLAGIRLQFRVKMVNEMEVRDLENLVREYNVRALKYGRSSQIPPLAGSIDLDELMSSMRPEVFRAARLSLKADKGRFVRSIQAAVDAGNPMIWGVILGLVPEKGLPQASGGHARLIVGYNTTTNECLYSDSWGLGHDCKRMSLDDAWLMHQFSLLLIPSNLDGNSMAPSKSK